MADSGHILQVRELAFAYRPGRPILESVSFSAGTGKLLCVLGPNGSGKTTLLKCLLRLLTPQGGQIVMDGRELGGYSSSALARVMGYVPQTPQGWMVRCRAARSSASVCTNAPSAPRR